MIMVAILTELVTFSVKKPCTNLCSKLFCDFPVIFPVKSCEELQQCDVKMASDHDTTRQETDNKAGWHSLVRRVQKCTCRVNILLCTHMQGKHLVVYTHAG